MAITGPESIIFWQNNYSKSRILSFLAFDRNKFLIPKKECFGEFRTGKTQIAHTICVTAQARFLILIG